MTVTCISSVCRKPIESTWDFCPYCGEDNRSPARQVGAGEHACVYWKDLSYCLQCGQPHEDSYEVARKSVNRWCLAFLFGGLLLAFTVFNIKMAYADRPSFGRPWIQSWYENPVVRQGRTGRSYTRLLGDEICLYTGLVATLALGISLAIFVKYPHGDDTTFNRSF
jgi:hypothetical protein